MAVPAHDERDGEFAKKYDIEVIVLDVNDTDEERKRITEVVGGKLVKKYKLRDWVFARQRYWGEPFPIVFDENHKSYLVADSELPVRLPEVDSYEPTGTGESPLANIPEFRDVYGYINEEGEFVSCDKSDPKAKMFKRETNTMPQWAGSSWYWLRFPDAHNDKEIFSKESQEKFGMVDVYVGGVEHATRHLIYGRFWHKFLYDLGLVNSIEPFKRLETVGLVLGEGGVKMSKRLGNVINPDDVIREYGTDVARMYVMFMGPFGQTGVWDSKSIIGVQRFLERVNKLKTRIGSACKNENIIHKTVKKVAEDIEEFKFNTAISQMMILLNELESNGLSQDEYDKFMTILAPFAPESAKEYVTRSWPEYDEDKLTANEVTVVIQVNGKLRGNIVVAKDVSEDELLSKIKTLDIWSKFVTTEPKKIITIKNKLVNIVI
jgi:leucyl-tRNA synthetase